jgi:hypothetical protein
VSEAEHLAGGKSDVELAIETFVDRIEEIYPDLDREEFHEAIRGYVQDAVGADDGEEEGEEQEE